MAKISPAARETAQEAKLETMPVGIFQGYDSVSGAGLSTALTGKTNRQGATSGVSYRVCTDLETLSRELEIDQSFSVAYGPIGSADEKMKFVSSLDITTYSVSIVVYASHVLGKTVMTDVKLKSGIKPPVSDQELRDFFRGYGDCFLSSVSEGGEYYAVYTYYTETIEQQTELTASMKAQGILEGGNVDASLQASLNEFNSSTKTRTSFDQNMSGIRNPKFPLSDEVIDFAIEFPSMELTAPVTIGFETTGYEHVPGFGTFQPIAKNREFFVGNSAVGGLTAQLVKVQELQDQIAWIETIYNFYGGFTDTKLASVATEAKTDHTVIDEMIQRYEDDPIGTFDEPDLPSLENGTPSLEYDIKHSETYGGNGGHPFDDVSNVDTCLSEQTTVTALQLRSGNRIDNLMVSYKDLSEERTLNHGGNGGGLGNKLNLRQGQFVVKASGRCGSRVDQLTLTISNGDSVSGGGSGGQAFDWSVPPGSFLLGFAGRSGAELDAVQFVYANFLAATWTDIPD